MNFTYAWATNRQNILKRTDANRNIVFVPICEANRDYQEYLEWIAEGNTPDPAE